MYALCLPTPVPCKLRVLTEPKQSVDAVESKLDGSLMASKLEEVESSQMTNQNETPQCTPNFKVKEPKSERAWNMRYDTLVLILGLYRPVLELVVQQTVARSTVKNKMEDEKLLSWHLTDIINFESSQFVVEDILSKIISEMIKVDSYLIILSVSYL